jgi:hypothetical protein
VLVRFPEVADNFCMVVALVNNLDRLTVQVEQGMSACHRVDDRRRG